MTGENSFTDITIVIDTAGSAENMQAALVFKTVYLVGETFLYSQTVHHASYLNGDWQMYVDGDWKCLSAFLSS